MKKTVILAAAGMAAVFAHGAGFGIYEASSRGNAMGGAVVGDTGDATAVYYNPANMAFSTNVQVAAGVTFINPFCDITVDHVEQERMNSGWFTVPTFYLTVPLPAGISFGWGNYTEYGLGSRYGLGWDLAGDTQKTVMRQTTLNPTLAYRITDWWSVAVGARVSWIQFYSNKNPYAGDTYYMLVGGAYVPVPDAYHLNSRLKGDDWDIGYDAATTFKLSDDLSVGFVYRSQIRHQIKGHFDLNGYVANPLLGAMSVHGPASAVLTLPQSLTMGVNWNATKSWRMGATATFTEWASVKNIHFRLPATYGYTQELHWENTGRFGLGTEYDILDWLTVRGGYVYDMDPTSKYKSTTMLPAGDRHIIGSGLGFKLCDNLFLDIGYTFIRMNNDDRYITVKGAPGNADHVKRFSSRNGASHLISATVRYSF